MLLKVDREFTGNFKTSPEPTRDTLCFVIICTFFFNRCLLGTIFPGVFFWIFFFFNTHALLQPAQSLGLDCHAEVIHSQYVSKAYKYTWLKCTVLLYWRKYCYALQPQGGPCIADGTSTSAVLHCVVVIT